MSFVCSALDAGGTPVLIAQRSVMAPLRRRGLSRAESHPAWRSKYYLDALGLYRIFNAAEYRFYRDNSAPPAESDSPFATNATLPHEPADVYADGTWYLSVSYFNGVIDSGFLPIGAAGETYLRLDLAAGAETGSPPQPPLDVRLELQASGVVRVVASYFESGALRAGEYAIAYTTNGAPPPTDTPDVTEAIDAAGFAILSYDLPAQANGTTVKVRVQMRRNDGTVAVPDWVYSEDSTILTATADAAGPSVPVGGQQWPGRLPEDV